MTEAERDPSNPKPRIRDGGFFITIDTPIRLDRFVQIVQAIRSFTDTNYGWNESHVHVHSGRIEVWHEGKDE